ncbi:NAD(P)-binding protein [uncultured Desulfosarcina sp.]|uniref:NAD(P)-binding protein n=1 Tax=uncultured Desulfosarcina sp. TaxID=218289 RepID=UPI0029C81ADA|nr:NAD(P)-binding protein [uncultured Desulfosarcina sp.]
MPNHIKIVVIGAGFAGLSFCEALSNSNFNSFLLIEKKRSSLGGYASLGGIKVGLLPAGQRTADYFSKSDYDFYTHAFLRKYSNYLSTFNKSKTVLNLPDNVTNKYYKSFIIENKSIKNILASLTSKLSNKILFSEVESINRAYNESYSILFSDGNQINCDTIVIASGRSEKIFFCLRKLNESFNTTKDLIVGCRVTFEPESAERIFSYQHDFKIKSETKMQTYCFNYRGNLNTYKYLNNLIYAGSFDIKSNIGNTFLGKKTKICYLDAIKLFPQAIIKKFDNLVSYLEQINFANIKQDFLEFISIMCDSMNINLYQYYFPALEQYWPSPILKDNSLESMNIPNIYYIGDSSGVSYGFLQCYITACILSKKILYNENY